VISFGGDGTLNEVATGVAGSDTALGVLPGGSTNVFARTIGLPNDPVAASSLLVAGLENPDANIRPIGLGRVNGRFFCFHTGIGYDAAVVRTVETRASLKRWAGHPLFIYAALHTWLNKYDRHHPHFSVAADSAIGGPGGLSSFENLNYDPSRFVDDGYFTIVLNTNPYSFLGNRPLDLSPAAGLDKPLVAVTFRTMSAVAIIRTLAGALKGGGVTPSKHVACFNDVHELIVENAQPFPYQVDGDYLGESTRLHFRHVPEAVKLLFPVQPTGQLGEA
jgi:diacylglycerol kinase family enzyme